VGATPPRLKVKPTFHNPGQTRFTEFLIRENDLAKSGFDQWVFQPGMLFNSPDKWWGHRGKRDTPHEGLDLCLYRVPNGRIFCIDENTRIPVMYDGVVVAIVNDFLGKSLIVEHELSDSDSPRFCSIYGHTNPPADLQIGKPVKKGDILATLADSSRSKSGIRPHLHISLGWTAKFISYDRFDWETIGTWDMLTLLDPLDVLDRPYQVLENVTPG
jgi:murein DD-endopeptidase MepM/ murein hydrolase activator NlpD